MPEPIVLVLDVAERDTLIAALRTYQEAGYGNSANRPARIDDIANDAGHGSLGEAEIDTLIETRLNAPTHRTAYALMQEGGSSSESYLHLFDNKARAKATRRTCERAAYRTSRPWPVVLHADRYVSIEALGQAAQEATAHAARLDDE